MHFIRLIRANPCPFVKKTKSPLRSGVELMDSFDFLGEPRVLVMCVDREINARPFV